MLVISLGLLLIGGLVLISYPLVKMAKGGNKCIDGELTLEGGGEIVSASTQKNSVTLVVKKKPGDFELVRIDGCSGKLQSTVAIKVAPAK